MKNIFLIMILLLSLSCKNTTPKDYVVLSFNLTGFDGENNDLFFSSSYADLSIDKNFRKVYKINNNESIIDTLELEEGIHFIGDGSNYVMLDILKGSNISVSYDVKDYKNTLKITGEGVERSNYHFQKRLKKDKELPRERYKLEEDEFLSLHRRVKNELINFIKSYEGISEDFKVKEIRNLHYEYLMNLSSYERSHAYYTENEDFKVSDAFIKEFNNLDYSNEEDFIFSRDYQGLVFNHYNRKSLDFIEKNPEMDKNLALLLTLNTITNEKIRNPLFYRVAIPIDIEFTSELEPLYRSLIDAYSERFKYLQNEEVLKDPKLSRGMPSPKFNNFENLSGGVKSLDDFKGKYVYMDIWATWCGPCKDQIPFLKKAEEIYHDKNIEFVSVSVDIPKDYEKLIDMVKELNLGGTQLYANGEWKEAEFMSKYLVNSIPRFLLIDPEGNIVDADAPRPSTHEFFNLIDSLKL